MQESSDLIHLIRSIAIGDYGLLDRPQDETSDECIGTDSSLELRPQDSRRHPKEIRKTLM